MERSRVVGLALIALGALIGLPTLLGQTDAWFLIVGVVPVAAGLILATGSIRRTRLVTASAAVATLAGVVLIGLGAFALAVSAYGPIAAAFVVPPGVALLGIGLGMLALRRSPAAAGAETGPGEVQP